MEVWGKFIDQFDTEKVLNSVKGSLDDGDLKLDYNAAMAMFIKQPEKICQLLAVILDPDPLSREGALRCKESAKKFMTTPVGELGAALGGWIEVNSSFFARMVAPLLASATPVLTEVAKLVFQKVGFMLMSPSGNA
jgi:hypothetical protein